MLLKRHDRGKMETDMRKARERTYKERRDWTEIKERHGKGNRRGGPRQNVEKI
jgi:hypothetical protein